MNWQHDPHTRLMTSLARRIVVTAVIVLAAALIGLAGDCAGGVR